MQFVDCSRQLSVIAWLGLNVRLQSSESNSCKSYASVRRYAYRHNLVTLVVRDVRGRPFRVLPKVGETRGHEEICEIHAVRVGVEIDVFGPGAPFSRCHFDGIPVVPGVNGRI